VNGSFKNCSLPKWIFFGTVEVFGTYIFKSVRGNGLKTRKSENLQFDQEISVRIESVFQ